MRVLLRLCIVAGLVTGCTNSGEKETGKIVKGKVTIGHEVSAFTSCDNALDYWVYDTSQQLDSLYEVAKSKIANAEPYESLYCELEVVEEPKAEDGFASDYQGVYRVLDVIKVVPLSEVPDCKTPDKVYLEGGNDSIWHISLNKISEKHFSFRLELKEKHDTICGNLIQTKAIDGKNLILETFENAYTDGKKVQLHFNIEEPCTDGKQKAYNGSLTLLLDKEKFTGCGNYKY